MSTEELKAEMVRMMKELDTISKARKDESKQAEGLEKQVSDLKREAAELSSKLKGKASVSAVDSKVVYVSHQRKVEKLCGTPESAKDPNVEDWVKDVKAYLTTRNCSKKEGILFIKEHEINTRSC